MCSPIIFRKYRKIIVNAINNYPSEERAILLFLQSLQLGSQHRILDVGCGFGEKSIYLQERGFHVEGIEVNPEIVRQNCAKGFFCRTPGELQDDEFSFDVVLMLHVIEHFQPFELLQFMDSYLDRLRPDGHLIIATPLPCRAFYWDFDHVKPYHPIGIDFVFGGDAKQVQYYSRNKLKLVNLWFRRNPFILQYFPGVYLPHRAKWPVIVNLFLTILFRLSFGLVGRTSGWVGLYRKIPVTG